MAVNCRVAPAVRSSVEPLKRSLLAGPAIVVMVELVPVKLLSIAVTVYVVPAVVAVVNVVVATPFALVVLFVGDNEPPVPVLLQVTLLPDAKTALPLASASCAVIVTAVPATGLLLLDVTIYFAAGPGTMRVPVLVTVPPPAACTMNV